MIRNKDIFNSLPMLASVLGDQYGVNVRIGGSEARTDGKTIFIPALPLDCGMETLALVRGFLDHEAAHIRHTDFQAIRNVHMDALTYNLFNSIEDWRIERKLGEIYPGCKQNLRWLIRRMFVEKDSTERAGNKNPALSVLNYVLLTVRSWDVAELADKVAILKTVLETRYTGLTAKIDLVLDKVRLQCSSTSDAISYAFLLADCVKKSQQGEISRDNKKMEVKEPKTSQNDKTEEGDNQQSDNKESQSTSEDRDFASILLDEELPKGIGELLRSELASFACKNPANGFQKAVPATRSCKELEEKDVKEAMRASIALRAKLSCLLQSQLLKKIWIGRNGKLASKSLYRMSVGNPKVFLKEMPQKGLNTAVHILFDASGSMHGEPIRLALQACYAMAKSLENQSGISLALTAFPVHVPDGIGICPLLEYGKRQPRK